MDTQLTIIWAATAAGALLFFGAGFLLARARGASRPTQEDTGHPTSDALLAENEKLAAKLADAEERAGALQAEVAGLKAAQVELEHQLAEARALPGKPPEEPTAEATALGGFDRPLVEEELSERQHLVDKVQELQLALEQRRQDAESLQAQLDETARSLREKSARLTRAETDARQGQRALKDMEQKLVQLRSVAVESRARLKLAEDRETELRRGLEDLRHQLGEGRGDPMDFRRTIRESVRRTEPLTPPHPRTPKKG